MSERREPIDRFLESMRKEPPPDLARRITAGLSDPVVARRVRWEDLGDLSRRALGAAVLAFVASAALLATILAREPHLADRDLTRDERRSTDESLITLATPVERRVPRSLWVEVR
jgi:hypothetical protein